MKGFRKSHCNVTVAIAFVAMIVTMTTHLPSPMVVLSFSATTSIPSSSFTTKSTTTTTRVTTLMNHMEKSNNWSMMPDEPAPEVRSKNRSITHILMIVGSRSMM
jgi:hypothetical protein